MYVAIIRTLLIFHPPCQDGVEIRGCCFSHTVLIEQYTSDLIGKLLAKHGVLVGNLPLAMWQYDSIQEDALPEVIKYCGVFETLGEKRLASHLFPGLESLLPLVFQDITMEEVKYLSGVSTLPLCQYCFLFIGDGLVPYREAYSGQGWVRNILVCATSH